jgi:hypothetical protein
MGVSSLAELGVHQCAHSKSSLTTLPPALRVEGLGADSIF